MRISIHSMPASIASWLKSIQLKRGLVTLFAGFFLLTGTACGANPSNVGSLPADADSVSSSGPYDKKPGFQSELYKPTQKRQGGMNNYADDPQYDIESAQVGTQRLVDQAERNLQNRAGNPKEIFDNIKNRNPLRDKAHDSLKNVQDYAEKTKNDVEVITREGPQNLKANLERAKEAVPNIVGEAKENAKNATSGIQEGVEDLASGAQRAVGRAGSAIKDRADSATDFSDRS